MTNRAQRAQSQRLSSTTAGYGEARQWWRPFKQLNDVTVMHIDLSPNGPNEREAQAWLDSGERRRARQMRHRDAQRRYMLCRAALRSVLCDALDSTNDRLSIVAGDHGKPSAVVKGCPASISFNVSHSGHHGLIALADCGRIGVDVEERTKQRRNIDALACRVLGSAEQAELAAAAEQRKLDLFLDLWTLKEAVSKAYGAGLSWGVSNFEIPQSMRAGAQCSRLQVPQAPEIIWRIHKLGTDDFAAALAYEEPER